MSESNRVRQRPLAPECAKRLVSFQRNIEALYHLEPAPPVSAFTAQQEEGGREEVLVRESSKHLEILVLLPESSLRALAHSPQQASLDDLANALEGISHFVHLSERARTELPTTLLEMELQAEVDKFALLSELFDEPGSPTSQRTRQRTLARLHQQLYREVHFLHPASSQPGVRYRLANDLAARLWSKLLVLGTGPANNLLRRFYRAGQAGKIHLARAA